MKQINKEVAYLKDLLKEEIFEGDAYPMGCQWRSAFREEVQGNASKSKKL